MTDHLATRVLFLWIAGLVAAAAAHADAPLISVTGNVEEVRIVRPPVSAPSTPLPVVQFLPGDQVTVSATGCVQTGGAGKTWKRYVDPSGDNSDRLYHGRIQIPGATDGAETLEGVMRRENLLGRTASSPPVAPLVVRPFPQGVTTPQYLTLGYDDDNYDDNGYYDHDDGTGNQCQNLGDAAIELRIVHLPTGAPFPPLPGPQAPMDLWWLAQDDNLLPLNPLWGAQVGSNQKANGTVPDAGRLCNDFHDENDSLNLGNPRCTTWTPTVDEPSITSDPLFYAVCQASGGVAGAVHGHIDWGLATFTGMLVFNDHSVPPPLGDGDDDYDMTLRRADQASATTNEDTFSLPGSSGPLRSLGLEFDSDETIDYFDTPFWQQFHAAVDADSSYDQARSLLGGGDGATAVVIGLVGIDNKHDAHAELHPVLGLAVRVPGRSTLESDLWAFFARIRGDEGGCSQDLHAFSSLTDMRFLLPLPLAEHPRLSSSAVRANVTGASFGLTQLTDGLLLDVNFPASSDSPIVWGELTIAHDVLLIKETKKSVAAAAGSKAPAKTPGGPLAPGRIVARPTRRVITANRAITRLAEDDLAPLRRRLSAAEWQAFLNAYAHPPATPARALPRAVAITQWQLAGLKATRASGAGQPPPSQPVRQSNVKVAPRHRALAPTEPRRMVASDRQPNRAQLLLHQQMAAALVAAVGSARAHAVLAPPSGVTPTKPLAKPRAPDPWAMPGW